MDMQKIGRFLCTLRKEKGWTQAELAEKIGVTDKTISRWETGCYLAPVEMLLELSSLYEVTLNEILSGERIRTDSEYRQKAEENIEKALKTSVFTKRDVYRYFRKKWFKDHLIEYIILPVILLLLFIVGIVWRKDWLLYCVGGAAFLMIITERNFYRAYMEKHLYDGSGDSRIDFDDLYGG